MITPETLARHELSGLEVEITAATNDALVGIGGEVIGESERTLRLGGEERVRQVPKAGATFAFSLSGESVAPTELDRVLGSDAEGVRVAIEGERLVSNPARRTETRGDSKWR